MGQFFKGIRKNFKKPRTIATKFKCKISYCWFSVSRHYKQIKIRIKTVQQIKSRIWGMKGGTYTKTLAKIQVRRTFRIRDIRRNVLLKLIKICMETPDLQRFVWRRHAGAHLAELQHDGGKPAKTSVTDFCYKSVNLFFEKLINIKVLLFLIHVQIAKVPETSQ